MSAKGLSGLELFFIPIARVFCKRYLDHCFTLAGKH
jgi:hypothetical protein